MTGRLFKERLSQHNRYDITFSKRSKSGRLNALRQLVQTAHTGFATQKDMSEDATIRISAATPNEHAGLQAVDYFVWALQRLYEQGEERYLAYLWEAFRLVHDIDDTRVSSQGVYYTQNDSLTTSVLKWRQ